MVRIQGSSDDTKLDALIRELVDKHGFRLEVTGWTRKTYDVHRSKGREGTGALLARIESFATTNGEIVIFDEEALPFAEELGGGLESQLGVAEAVVLQRKSPTT